MWFPTYLSWGVMAATLIVAGVWYWKVGHRSPQRTRRGAGLLVGTAFAIAGFVTSVWIGVYSEGSLEAALSPLGLAAAVATCLIEFGLGLLLAWQGARVLGRMHPHQGRDLPERR